MRKTFPFALIAAAALYGCDSGEDAPHLAIPDTVEDNYGSFRVNGTRYEPTDRSEFDAVDGYSQEYPKPDGEVGLGAAVFLTDRVYDGPSFEEHALRFVVGSVPGPGTYRVRDIPGTHPRGRISYEYTPCPAPPCPNPEVLRPEAWTLTVREFDETGIAGRFSFEVVTPGGDVRRVTEGEFAVRFSNAPE